MTRGENWGREIEGRGRKRGGCRMSAGLVWRENAAE